MKTLDEALAPKVEVEEEEFDEEQLAAELKEKARKHLDKITSREKECKDGWWKSAKNSMMLYSQYAKKEAENFTCVYNILYSNTEVLVPSLYSATAKPDVRARFRDTVLKPIPEVIERFLVVATDGTQPGFESFDDAIKDCVLSSLTAAAGMVRIRLYEGQDFPLQYESVAYKDVLWEKEKKWSKIGWLAFRHDMSKAELAKQFSLSEDAVNQSFKSGVDDAGKATNTCCVWEFWDKASRQVWFLCEEWADILLEPPSDDPLKLKGFFPTPGPLMLTLKPGDLEPIPLYEYYRNQAEELDRVTVRLNKVLSAIRVRGAYNSLMGEDMAKILSDTDMENGLVPASESAALAGSGGFDRNIWILPIEKLIQVAQSLYQARESIKQVIYELTGISDIIRGSNAASETATASDLKNKWGTIRLRKMQTAVANYVRDIFRQSVDCGSSSIPAATWKKLVQLPIPLQEEKTAAEQRIQTQQMIAEITGQPPAPPDPQTQAMLAQPSFEELLQKISDDVDRTFTINIQTSSTIDLDTASEKAEVAEFMNAMGQMLAGLAPLAQIGPTGMNAAKTLLVEVCKRFKLGLNVVDAFEAIQPPEPPAPPAPPPPDPAVVAEGEAKMAQLARDAEIADAEKNFRLAEIEQKKQLLALDIERARLTVDAARAKIAAAAQAAAAKQTAQVPQNAPLPR